MSLPKSCVWLCAAAIIGAATAQLGMPGGWFPVTAGTTEANEITDFVQGTLNARTNSMYLAKITSIAKLERQVVAGFNYRIQFDFSRTTCTKNSGKGLEGCNEFSKVEACSASVFKSLQQTLELTTFNCQPKVAKRACAGCIVDADGKFSDIANFAIDEVNKAENSNRKLIGVTKAQTQVVAGTLYHLTLSVQNGDQEELCAVKVWERVWLNDRQLTSSQCQPKVSKRACSGCIVDANGNFDEIANFAISKVNEAENSDRQLLGVTKAQTQVVAGMMYYLTLSVQNGDQEEECTVSVWERLWLNDRRLTSAKCLPKTSKRQLAGGITSQDDVNAYADIAKFAVSELSKKENAISNLLEVSDVKTQVVAGILYHMTVKVNTDGQGERVCNVKVWQRVWMPEESDRLQLTDSDCSPAVAKRAGNIEEQPEPEQFREVAQFGVEEVNAQSNQAFVINKVLKASTQVVAGTMYYLTVEVASGAQVKVCDVKVWERVWLSPPRILTGTTC